MLCFANLICFSLFPEAKLTRGAVSDLFHILLLVLLGVEALALRGGGRKQRVLLLLI